MEKSKIYTRSGDKGTTSLVGGTRTLKNDPRLEAYGTIDELNSYIGLVLCSSDLSDIDRTLLNKVQNILFNIGSNLATPPDSKYIDITSNPVADSDIKVLEDAIDRLDSMLPPLKSFIMPGGSVDAANAHIARTVCRRAERCIITLVEIVEVDKNLISYINRLSDYLFLLARVLSHSCEVEWEVRK